MRKKILVRRDGEEVVVGPVGNIPSLKGILKHKVVKGKNIEEVIKLEKRAWEKGAVKRYLKTLKK